MNNMENNTKPFFNTQIPSDWEVKRLKEILVEGKLGGNYENAEANIGVPVIKMGNLDRGAIKTDKIQYLPENEVYNNDDILQNGDLLFNTRNTLELVGKVAIWKNELPFAVYNSNLMRMKFNNHFVDSNWFMNYAFNSHYALSQLRGIATRYNKCCRNLWKGFRKNQIFTPTPSRTKSHRLYFEPDGQTHLSNASPHQPKRATKKVAYAAAFDRKEKVEGF